MDKKKHISTTLELNQLVVYLLLNLTNILLEKVLFFTKALLFKNLLIYKTIKNANQFPG